MTFRNIKKLYVLFHWLTFESYIYKRNGVNQQRDYTSITICERMIFLQQWAIYIRFYMKYIARDLQMREHIPSIC